MPNKKIKTIYMFKWYYKVLVTYCSKYSMTAVTFYVKGFRIEALQKQTLFIY